jgi:arylsulfatase A-like enzyme
MDLLPTMARLAGAQLPAHKIDGKDIWPLLAGQAGAKSPHEASSSTRGFALEAVRSGPWKLHFPHAYRTLGDGPRAVGGVPSKYKQAKTELALYNLETDIGEQHNVADQNPDVVARLQRLADAMRQDLGDSARKAEGTGRRPSGQV